MTCVQSIWKYSKTVVSGPGTSICPLGRGKGGARLEELTRLDLYRQRKGSAKAHGGGGPGDGLVNSSIVKNLSARCDGGGCRSLQLEGSSGVAWK